MKTQSEMPYTMRRVMVLADLYFAWCAGRAGARVTWADMGGGWVGYRSLWCAGPTAGPRWSAEQGETPSRKTLLRPSQTAEYIYRRRPSLRNGRGEMEGANGAWCRRREMILTLVKAL